MLETFNSAEKRLHIRSNFACKDFLQKLNHLRSANQFTDVILCQEDSSIEIAAHRLILSCCSPYFNAMFNGAFQEGLEKRIHISGVSGHALQAIIDYIYSGDLVVTLDNVEELLQVTDLLLLEQTKKCLLKFLKQTLNSGNCLFYHHLASFYADDDLVQASISFLCRNFKAVLNESQLQFQELFTLDLWKRILQEETITVSDECTILDAICTWTIFDVETRGQEFQALMEQVKKDEIPQEKWLCFAQKYPSLVSLLAESKNKLNDVSVARRRKSVSSFLIAIGFDSQDVEYLDLDELNSSSGSWRILTKIPMRYGLSGASLAVANNRIFITGGVGPRGILKAVRRLLVFDIDANEWKIGPSMNHARKCHGCYIRGDFMYVVGGTDSQQPVMTVESLHLDSLPLWPINDSNKIEDMQSNLWKIVATLESWHNGSSGLLGLGDKMLAISVYGTAHDKQFSNGSWASLDARNDRIQRDHPGIGAFEDKLILAGGTCADSRQPLNTVESFDINSQCWTTWETPLNIAREGPGVIQVDQGLLVIGGRGEHVNGSVEVWNPGDSQWRVLPHLKVKHSNQEYQLALWQSHV